MKTMFLSQVQRAEYQPRGGRKMKVLWFTNMMMPRRCREKVRNWQVDRVWRIWTDLFAEVVSDRAKAGA